MGFVRLFLGLVVREHAIKLWPYLRRRSPISHMPCSVLDHPRIGLDNPQPCHFKPAFHHGPEPSENARVEEHVCGSGESTSPRQPKNRSNSNFGLISNDLLVFPAGHLPNGPFRTCTGTSTAVEVANSTQRSHQPAIKLSSDVRRPTKHQRLEAVPDIPI